MSSSTTQQVPTEALTEEQAEKKRLRDERKAAQKLEKAQKAQKAKQKSSTTTAGESGEADQDPTTTSSHTTEGGGATATEKKKEKKSTFRLKQQVDNRTPHGEKKDLSEPLSGTYDPPTVEAAWSAWWEKKRFFSPDYFPPGASGPAPDHEVEKFVMVIPPPNVTGSLHIGHALTNSIEDAIARWHRMKGRKVLWVPGIDHAGIATQSVVERKLWTQEGKTKYDFGRTNFVEKVWEWKKEYGYRITHQLRRLGSSLDWERERFTMDEMLSRAVIEAFVLFYEAGLIYRANRLVNWSCSLRTAISDLECDDLELNGTTRLSIPGYDEKRKFTFGVIWEFAYPVWGMEDTKVFVATTRPETMLGDTAVAIHPDDQRYKHLHGKYVKHPFVDRKLPIICDPVLVDMTFGTGAVKVTPGHDPNDYETGLRHKLEFINIFNDDGTMNDMCGEFVGLKRFECREKVLQRLGQLNLFKGVHRENKMRLKQCSRSGDIIEPLMKPQWWVNMDDLARRSAEVVRTGELKVIPEAKTKQWFQFLENIQPWCISRQLWWGHQIPAWLIVRDGKKVESVDTSDPQNWVIGRNDEEAHQNALKILGKDASFTLSRDPDVLDTWFSSGLFPFSVFGWPDQTSDMNRFYPTSLLETGHDILFFWVARMVMMGLQLTDKLPFNTVYLHSMVRDAHGRKMSKSLGNVIDPIDVIEGITLEGLHQTLYKGNLANAEIEKAKEGQRKDFPNGISECGTDALRFALCAYCQQGRDIKLDIKRVESYRTFCNKLWNASKLAWMFWGSNYVPPDSAEPSGNEGPLDKWILHRLNIAANLANKGFEKYEFGDVTLAIYSFWLYDLCDVYLEVIKPIMHSPSSSETARQSVLSTLYTVFEEGYRLLSPFMPFITEELWQRLPLRKCDLNVESICVARYPIFLESRHQPHINDEIGVLQKLVLITRSMQAMYNTVKAKKKPKVTINVHDDALKDLLERYQNHFVTLSYVEALEVTFNDKQPPLGCAAEIPDSSCEVYLHIKGLLDIELELTKLATKLKQSQSQYEILNHRINSTDFAKVPESVQEKEIDKLEKLKQEIDSVQIATNTFQKLKQEV